MMEKDQKRIIEICENKPNQEVCGFIKVVGAELVIVECENIAEDKENNFQFSVQDSIFAQDKDVVGIFHSHTDCDQALSTFSHADIDAAEEFQKPLYLYVLKTKKWLNYTPNGYSRDLIGRQFIRGINDCYTELRDYYRQELKINLRDYIRYEEVFEGKNDYIMENIWKEGFITQPNTSVIHKNDILVFRRYGAYPRHLGVFVGNGRFLHQPAINLSCVEILSGFWQSNLKYVLRHKNFV